MCVVTVVAVERVVAVVNVVSSCSDCHMKEVHAVAFTDLAEMFSILKKCQRKLDFLIQAMPFIREQKLRFNRQPDSIHAKVFI